MPTITNLPQLKINYLTQAQYDAAIANDEIDEDQLYFTPDGFLDKFYPVGTIYETLDSTFDPNTAWGGVWDRVIGRVILGAFDAGELTSSNQVNSNSGFGSRMTSDSNPSTWEISIGDTGGEYSHLSTAAESGTTAHGHGFTKPTVTTPKLTASNSHYVTSATIVTGYNVQLGSLPSGGNYRYLRCENSGYNLGRSAPTIAAGESCTVSGGSVGTSTAASASAAHNNTMPFLAANIWKRIA